MGRISPLIVALFLLACSTDRQELANTLENYLEDKEVVLDNVISCAASNDNDHLVSVFFYPRDSAYNFRYFESLNADVDKNDFSNYEELAVSAQDVFNGYLKKFEVAVIEEKWVIVVYEENGKIQVSNPIRLKQRTKSTQYLPQNVTVDLSANSPVFSWMDGSYDDTKIYFQVLSSAQEDLISGTYTYEKTFRFYNLDNVVLNITKGTPPTLVNGESYQFLLMGVSEDNWVNLFAVVPFDYIEN